LVLVLALGLVQLLADLAQGLQMPQLEHGTQLYLVEKN
jgi:hypothetical protein